MTREEREYRDEQITDFRYRLVAELANPYLSAAERRPAQGQRRRSQGPASTPPAASPTGWRSTASTAEPDLHHVHAATPAGHGRCRRPRARCYSAIWKATPR